MNFDDWLKRFRKNPDAAILEIYRAFRGPFLGWSKKRFNLDEADAVEVFQRVIMAFYENVNTGKLTILNASVKTYLFNTGKNIILKDIRNNNQKNTELTDDFEKLNLKDEVLNEAFAEEDNSYLDKLAIAWKKLSERCRQLLKLFYFENLSHREIAKIMGFKSGGVSRAMKLKCLNRLRKLINDQ